MKTFLVYNNNNNNTCDLRPTRRLRPSVDLIHCALGGRKEAREDLSDYTALAVHWTDLVAYLSRFRIISGTDGRRILWRDTFKLRPVRILLDEARFVRFPSKPRAIIIIKSVSAFLDFRAPPTPGPIIPGKTRPDKVPKMYFDRLCWVVFVLSIAHHSPQIDRLESFNP